MDSVAPTFKQIAVNDGTIFALADDGTVWFRPAYGDGSGHGWKKMKTDTEKS